MSLEGLRSHVVPRYHRAAPGGSPARSCPTCSGCSCLWLPPVLTPVVRRRARAVVELFAFIMLGIERLPMEMLCGHGNAKRNDQGPRGAVLGALLSWEHGSCPRCPSLALHGHGEANAASQPMQHVEAINNLTRK